MIKFDEIQSAIEQNRHWLGQEFKGAIVEELVPVPVEYEKEFWGCYVPCLKAEEAFAMLMKRMGCFSLGEDYQIEAVLNKSDIHSKGVLFHVNIEELESQSELNR